MEEFVGKMPSELNLTESWPFPSFWIIRQKKRRYPFVDYPRPEFPWPFLTGPENVKTAEAAHGIQRLEKLSFF
jgi:hypothetical protein